MSSATEVLTRKPKNIAIATNPAHELKILEADIPEPGSDDCLLHVKATGICGSDVCDIGHHLSYLTNANAMRAGTFLETWQHWRISRDQ